MSVLIESFNLTKKFNNLTAVEDLSIQINKGEILGFLGPNGAGKTTTIRMLTGIIAPTKGYAMVAGFRPDKEVERFHEVIGLLTEVPGFYERLSARENLLYFARFYDIDADSQVDKYLQKMDLWERRSDKVNTFSKGMKQRLALTRALVHEPEVLFLDEPTTLAFMFGVIASSRANDPKTAQNIAIIVILPILAIVGAQLIGFTVFTPANLFVLSIVIGILNFFVLRIAVSLFQREAIVVRWR
jgi:ABC-type transport system involved in cytochrome c biogenesis ATPase subunit